LLLAIDSSAGTSAAIFDGETLLAQVEFEDPFGHAENIGLAISDVLQQAALRPKDLSSVVIGRGPAPYTGLRVGMAAGIALARTLGIRLYGVMALDAIAFGDPGNLVVTTDAKRGELFYAKYEAGVRTQGPEVIAPGELAVPSGFDHLTISCNAEMVGRFAISALESGADLSDVSALYLRSVDVNVSKGKRVTG
jgi:tRNA threonylcarbamoyl adenosine modification protein YeaZ